MVEYGYATAEISAFDPAPPAAGLRAHASVMPGDVVPGTAEQPFLAASRHGRSAFLLATPGQSEDEALDRAPPRCAITGRRSLELLEPVEILLRHGEVLRRL